jgi:hypothetical protein
MKKLTIALLTTLTLLSATEIEQKFENREDFFIPTPNSNSHEIFSFSNNNENFITGSNNENLLLWSLKLGLPIKDFKDFGYIFSAKKDTNSRYILIHSSQDYNDSIELFDMEKEMLITLASEEKIEGSSYRTDISKDGKTVIFTEGDCNQNIIKVWDINRSKVIKTFLTHTPDLLSVKISPKSNFIATMAREGYFNIWSMNGKKLFKLKFPEMYQNRYLRYSLEISSDEKYILIGSNLFDIKKQKVIKTFDTLNKKKIYFSAKPDELLIYSDNNITFWDINKSIFSQSYKDTDGEIISFSKDSNTEYFKYNMRLSLNGQYYSKEKIFDSNEKKTLPYDGNRSIKSTINQNLIARTDSGKIDIIDIYNNKKKIVLDMEKTMETSSSIISRDARHIASLSDNHAISIWDIDKNRLLHSIDDKKIFEALTFNSTGEYLIAMVNDIIKIFETKSGSLLKSIKLNRELFSCNDLYLTANDKYLIIKSSEKTLVWDFEKSRLIKSDFSISSLPNSIVSKNDRYIISESGSSIKLYDLKDLKKPIKEFIEGDKGSWLIFDYKKKMIFGDEKGKFLFKKEFISPRLGSFLRR